jgi:hypothetical protein
MSKVLTTAATIIVLGLAATGAADARGGGGFGGGHIGGMAGLGGAHLGGMGGAHFGGLGEAHLGGMGAMRLGSLGATHMSGLGGADLGGTGAAHMDGVGGARAVHGFARHGGRFDNDWGYAASCAIYAPYYRPWCLGDVDSGIMQSTD